MARVNSNGQLQGVELVQGMPPAQPELIRGKVVAMTGCTDGIGLAMLKELIQCKPAKVYLLARNKEKAETVQKFAEKAGVESEILLGDLGLAKDLLRLGQELAAKPDPLDLFISNAGIFLTKLNARKLTADDLEIHFATNFMSMVHLVTALTPKLKESQGRIVVTGSYTSMDTVNGLVQYDNMQGELRTQSFMGMSQSIVYGHSKLLQHVWAKEFAARNPEGPAIVVVDPGMVSNTNIEGWSVAPGCLKWLLGTRTVENGGFDGLLYACLSKQTTGTYLDWNMTGAPKVRPAVPLGQYPGFSKTVNWDKDTPKVWKLAADLVETHQAKHA